MAVQNNPEMLEYASYNLRLDKNFCKECLENDLTCESLKHMNKNIVATVVYETIKEDPSFMIHLTTYCDKYNYKRDYDNFIEDTIHLKNDLQKSLDDNNINSFKEIHPEYFTKNIYTIEK